jgi:hypothetical protein
MEHSHKNISYNYSIEDISSVSARNPTLFIERRRLVSDTSAPFLEGPEFKSRAWRPAILTEIFTHLFKRMPRYYSK